MLPPKTELSYTASFADQDVDVVVVGNGEVNFNPTRRQLRSYRVIVQLSVYKAKSSQSKLFLAHAARPLRVGPSTGRVFKVEMPIPGGRRGSWAGRNQNLCGRKKERIKEKRELSPGR